MKGNSFAIFTGSYKRKVLGGKGKENLLLKIDFMAVCFVRMCTPSIHCSWRPEEGIKSPGNGITVISHYVGGRNEI